MGDGAELMYPGVAEYSVVEPSVVAVAAQDRLLPGQVDTEEVRIVGGDVGKRVLDVPGVGFARIGQLGARTDQVRDQRLVRLCLGRRGACPDAALEVALEAVGSCPGVAGPYRGRTRLGLAEEPFHQFCGVPP
ncbi:hypothetical protein [Streptomyces sp. Ac-502]|uniref:hypothetical protein n=1 Tax=Streptomyces sp. Ac-502 TaxID=3342801 RepID=UPI003862BCC8